MGNDGHVDTCEEKNTYELPGFRIRKIFLVIQILVSVSCLTDPDPSHLAAFINKNVYQNTTSLTSSHKGTWWTEGEKLRTYRSLRIINLETQYWRE
jgi:hypothetical protein